MSDNVILVPQRVIEYLKVDVDDSRESREYYNKRQKDPRCTPTERLIFSAIATLNARGALHSTCLEITLGLLNNTNTIFVKASANPRIS